MHLLLEHEMYFAELSKTRDDDAILQIVHQIVMARVLMVMAKSTFNFLISVIKARNFRTLYVIT